MLRFISEGKDRYQGQGHVSLISVLSHLDQTRYFSKGQPAEALFITLPCHFLYPQTILLSFLTTWNYVRNKKFEVFLPAFPLGSAADIDFLWATVIR